MQDVVVGDPEGALADWSWVIVWLLPWEQEVQVIEDTDHNNLQAKIIYLILLWDDLYVCGCVCALETRESVIYCMCVVVYVCMAAVE